MTESEQRNVELRCAFCGTRNRLDMNRAADRPRCGECGRPFLLDRPVKVAGEDLQALVAGAREGREVSRQAGAVPRPELDRMLDAS